MGEPVHHIVKLPYGYTVEFSYDGVVPEKGKVTINNVLWQPHVPRIENKKAWKRFFAEYKQAHRKFLIEVASVSKQKMAIAYQEDGTYEIISPDGSVLTGMIGDVE